jgi:hypothetical protein
MINHECKLCKYSTIRHSSLTKHFQSKKHMGNVVSKTSAEEDNKNNAKDKMECIYCSIIILKKNKSRHLKVCKQKENELIIITKENDKLKHDNKILFSKIKEAFDEKNKIELKLNNVVDEKNELENRYNDLQKMYMNNVRMLITNMKSSDTETYNIHNNYYVVQNFDDHDQNYENILPSLEHTEIHLLDSDDGGIHEP